MSLFEFTIINSNSKALGSSTSGSAVCISPCLTPLTFIRRTQNTVGFCNQLTLLIVYYISFRLATHVKVIDTPIQVPNIFDLTVSFKFLNFSFYKCLVFSLKCLLASCLTLFSSSTLLWLGSCNQCNLACFL